jgi:predicted O-methyltransferase YrrM
MRYNQLLPLIQHHKPKLIVEVGTWNGIRALMMCQEAIKHQESVHYVGFDLFEDATEETDARELNVKAHATMAEVESRLLDFAEKHPGFTFRLIKGDTRKTLAPGFFGKLDPDFAFIDGGHSIETIRSDYEALKHSKVVVMDDFYTGRDTNEHGCNEIVAEESHIVLPHKDPVKGGGKVQMVILPREAWPGKANLVIKTKNCVPDEEIQANIRHAKEKMPNWIVECKAHDLPVTLVSAGPSFKDHLDELRGRRVVCVKHSHDELIENGIIPWACMLLDPRSHVQDFIENPHPDVIYFVASMCHPTTIDRLIERDATIWGYHAYVGAGEQDIIGEGIMVGGGSTSAVRGISVLHALGFRSFEMYGYDSCYYEKPDFTTKDKNGNQRYFEVEVSGRKFWSDAELVAQAQDFDKLMAQEKELELNVIGDGMIPHIWNLKRKILPDFSEVIGA